MKAHGKILAAWAAALEWRELPQALREKALDHVVDAIGVMYSGIEVEACAGARRAAAGWGIASESTVLGTRSVFPAPTAAFLNALHGRIHTYDDTYEPGTLHAGTAVVAAALALAEKHAIDLARLWLDRIGLLERADDAAGNLPYGDQRRLEIARAMCTEPALLCLDEPAAGLNARESAALSELLLSIRADHGASILLIEHDMSVVMEISDHVVVLDYGRKISDGSTGFVRSDPRVIAAYLGVEDTEVKDVEQALDLMEPR